MDRRKVLRLAAQPPAPCHSLRPNCPRLPSLRAFLHVAVIVITFLALSWLGLLPADGIYVLLARIFTVLYFAFFLLMPWYTSVEKTRPVPTRVTYHD